MISFVAEQMKKSVEEAYEKGGPEAAKRAQHGNAGGALGMGRGAVIGSAIGTAILPGIGTGIGLFVGSLWGAIKGAEDETPADNLRSAGKFAGTIGGMILK